MGVLRLFLALVVLSSHLRSNVLEPAGLGMSWVATLGFNGGYSLLMFYVISGFLISTALAEKYPADAAGVRAFYRGRFVRIFSLYWPMAAICLLVWPDARYGVLAASGLNRLSDVVLIGIDWHTLFQALATTRPWTATLIGLEPSWSLGAELAFYLVAPWLLRTPRFCLAAALASILVRVYVYATFGPGSLWNYLFWPSTLIFFLLGHFARVLATRFRWLTKLHAWAPILMLSFGATMLGGATVAPWDGPRFWITFLAFATAMPGLFLWTSKSRLQARIADLSFPVYLAHPIVLTLFAAHGGLALAASLKGVPAAGFALLTGASAVTIAAAVLIHRAIETPFGRLLQALTRRRDAPSSASFDRSGAADAPAGACTRKTPRRPSQPRACTQRR